MSTLKSSDFSKPESSDSAEVVEASDSSDGSPVSSPGPHTRRYRKVYRFFGFTRSYNFPLWAIFSGGMVGFSLSRLENFNYDGIFQFQTIPTWWYYFSSGSLRVGMILHLVGCLPAGLLMVLQFVPAIRHKWIFFHRVNGYFVLVLMLLSNAGACIALRHNDNGTRVNAQAAESMLVILTTISMGMAYWNIKRLQIDQHRAWMLRAMFLFGTIVSFNIIAQIALPIMKYVRDYYTVMSCERIDFTYKQYGVDNILELKYPQCLIPNGTVDGNVVVKAYNHVQLPYAGPENVGAAVTIPFATGLWLAMILHIVGVEIYLSLTPREAARLRQVSYERQLAAGYKNPGNGGTTVDRFGDAEEWRPRTIEV